MRTKALADQGRLDEALALGRSAVEYALRSDFPDVHGGAYLALAHALRASGAAEQAREAVERAIESYQLRGDVVLARKAAALL